MIADARANYFSNQKLSKRNDNNFILTGKVSRGLGIPEDFEILFDNVEKAEKYITSHNLEYYIENSEQNIEDEKEYRYEVTQTSDAYDEGENFAVWDNENNDYHFDKDGTIKTFETEEEAEEYLKTYVLSNKKTSVEKNNTEKENPKQNIAAENLKIGDVIKLPPVVFTYSNGKEKTFPSEYGVVTNIENNMISFQTYSDKKLQNRITRTGQTMMLYNKT